MARGRKAKPGRQGLAPTVKLPRGAVAPRCQKRKRTGAQCEKAARKGWTVCGSHGAGYAKREREGTRQNPKTVNVTHGGSTTPATKALLADIDPAFAADLAIYLDDPAKRRDLDTLLAFAWATLHRVARQVPEVIVTQHGEQPPAIVATLQMLAMTLERVAKIEWKIYQSGAPTLTVAQAQRLVKGMVEVLHEFVPGSALESAIARLERLANAVVGDRDPGAPPAEREADAGPP